MVSPTASDIVAYYENTIEMLAKRSQGMLPSYMSKEDLVMELRIELLTKLKNYDKTLATLDTYVSRILEYRIANFINEVSTPTDIFDGDAESFDRLHHTHDTKIGVDVVKGGYKALSQSLSSNDSEYTLMILLAEGHTQMEIADALGISQSTVSRHINNIRDNLANELK